MTIFAPVVRLGLQEPRVSSVPASATSAGPDVVEYASSIGITLDPWQRLALDAALGESGRLWTAFEVAVIVSRQNGKGGILEARELAGIELFGERLILHSAHEMKTCEEALLRMEQIIEGSPDLDRAVSKIIRANGKEAIYFKSGARIKYVARSKGSGRGFSGDLVILDEAMLLPAQSMAALVPTLSARPNPQVWYTGSAALPESDHLHRLRRRALAGGDTSLAYLEWSVTDSGEVDLDDVDGWYQSNPALGIRITEDHIRKERATLDDESFGRERLGVWDPELGSSSVITDAMWTPLVDRESQPVGVVCMAVDVTPDRTSGSVGVAGRRSDGLTHVEVIENLPGTGWITARVVDLVAKYGCSVTVDPRSPAGGLMQELRDAGVTVDEIGSQTLAQACGAFFDAVNQGRLRHIAQPPLTRAVLAARKRPLGDAWAWARKDATDVSPLVAVTLARFALGEREEPLTVPEVVSL